MTASLRLFFSFSVATMIASAAFAAGCGGEIAPQGLPAGQDPADTGTVSPPTHPHPKPDGGTTYPDGGDYFDGGYPDDAPWYDDGGEWWDAEPYDGGPYDGGEWWDAEPYDGGDGGEWWDAEPYDGGPWVDATPGDTLPSGCDPSISEGNIDAWLAFDSTSAGSVTSHVFVVRPDGCDLRQLTFGSDNEREPAFSPDGAYLTYTSDRGGSAQIWRMDLATKTAVALTAGATGARHSAWSPDGTLITFVTDDGIVWTMQRDGSDLRHVAQDGNGSCCTSYRAPTFSGDGTEILFDRTNEIDAVKLDGTGKRYVVANWTTSEANPDVAPNGLRVAYEVWCGSSLAIFSAPYTGLPGDPCSGTRITRSSLGDSANPAWGPNGLFAFERTATGRIAVTDSASGYAWEILDATTLQTNPAWAPPGWQP